MIKTNIDKLSSKASKAKISELPVREFMTEKVVTLTQGTKIYSAVKTLSVHKVSGAPVVDGSRHLLGIVTEYDLLLQAAILDVAEPIQYTEKVSTLKMNSTLNEAIVMLYKTKYKRIPVVDDMGHVVGVVSRIDVLNRLMGI